MQVSQKTAEFIGKYLNQTVPGLLVRFLGVTLPEISDDWWNNTVIGKLSYTQLERVKRSNISVLDGLDLAALLRVFDQNWYEISQNRGFTRDDRHYVKEMPFVRNRWAHMPGEGYNTDDVYRDLDTIQRFLKLINAEQNLIEELQNVKLDVLNVPERRPADSVNAAEEKQNGNQFRQNQIVEFISNPSIFGPIMEIREGRQENTIYVYIDGKIVPYFESQLKLRKTEEIQELSCEEFHSYLSALEIRFPGMSNLFSLNSARVDFIPYQFRPVLRFIRAERQRMLIADSVGVGKTIEAGLILRELQARKDVRSILIICPRPMITEKKWLLEMRRFDEDFVHLDGKLLRFCLDEADKDAWPERYEKAIIPYSLFDEKLLEGDRRHPGLYRLEQPPHFDLVIVDEAHHIKNPDTYSHEAVRFFCDNAEAVLFLTATPIQLGTDDLYTLLHILRPDLIIDKASFDHMAEPNPHINLAISAMREKDSGWTDRAKKHLDDAAETPWGRELLAKNPGFNEIREQLGKNDLSREKRVELITAAENMQTFSGIINRTRKRDIKGFTKRRSITVNCPFTPKQQRLHDTLLQINAEILRKLHCGISVTFMMCTIRRQAASCIFGLKPFLKEILTRHLGDLFWDVGDDTDEDIDGSFVSDIESQINSLIAFTDTLDDDDPKYNNLLQIVREKQRLPNNRIMLFSSFRHTLSYLFEKLDKEGFRAGVIHGGIPDEERVEKRDRFKKDRGEDDAIDILLFSEVGCEGLDYQFCDCIVNYDLPWNPMRIEQRIGRIDRQGQMSPVIAIYNMITPGTIDADIYERCLSRIDVFEKSIGDCEEILGKIFQKIKSIADDFTLDEESRREKLQQLADNEIRHIQETEKLEEEKYNFIGLRIPQERLEEEIEYASSYWLSSQSLYRLSNLYLQRRTGKDQEFIIGEKKLKTLRLSVEARNFLLEDYKNLPSHRRNPMYSKWQRWLIGSEPYLQITFDQETASENLGVTYITPLHPLVRQAALFFKTENKVYAKMMVVSNILPQSDYYFSMYHWRLHGSREDQCLKVMAETDIIADHIKNLLKDAVDNPSFDFSDVSKEKWEKIEDTHYNAWNTARINHKEKDRRIIQFQRESLSRSHKERMALLEERLKISDNERISKMLQGMIAKAASDYARHIQNLELAETKADIVSEPVAYGVLSVRNEN